MEQKRRQRGQERVSCSTEVVVNDSLVCRSLDISTGGLYILTDHHFAVGSIITVTLGSGTEKIDVKARVKHVAEGLGAGIMFIDLDDVMKQRIGKFVQETTKLTSSAG